MKQIIDIMIATLTLVMEAGGEPRNGKLAVAFVLANRVKAGRSMTDVILDPWDFSCWNTDSPTRMNLDKADDRLFAECQICVLAAMFDLEPDPTHGAIFYLNKESVIAATAKPATPTTPAIAGKLPNWWNIDALAASEVTIGHHTFRRHK
jgi:N-acetylmuramoyl-L-alanine amidase